MCLIFYDASALYNPKAGTKCMGIAVDKEFGRQQGKYLSRFGNPAGWFLVFLRYRDDDGAVRDDLQGIKFLFASLDPYLSISRTDRNQPAYSLRIEPHTP
jgi:hypothetical protein